MTAFLAVALLLGGTQGPFTIEVTAVEAGTHRPVAGAVIDITHRHVCSKKATREGEPQCTPTHPHPKEVLSIRGTTGRDGKLRARVPDLEYEVGVVVQEGQPYLQPWELQRFIRALEELRKTSTSEDGKTMQVQLLLVPRAMVEAPGVIRTPERAAEIARERLKGCELPSGGPAPQGYEGEWYVKLGVATVRVNALTGATWVYGCNAACCQDPKDAPTATPLYSPAEALEDALAEPLEYVGTGPWHGIFKIQACLYRNSRVLVANVYCTLKEINSARVDVLHPSRGRVSVYAEAREPISTIDRSRYLEWKFDSEDPLPGVRVDMAFGEVAAYDAGRYARDLPSCWAGRGGPGGSGTLCRKKAPEVERAWAAQATPWLEEPPPGWYPLVKELRRRAARDGRPDPRGR